MSEYPQRPNHADFWALSALINDLDGRIDNDPSVDRIEAEIERLGYDPGSVIYLATQRAIISVAGTEVTPADVAANLDEIAMRAAMSVEGFLLGVLMTKAKPPR